MQPGRVMALDTSLAAALPRDHPERAALRTWLVLATAALAASARRATPAPPPSRITRALAAASDLPALVDDTLTAMGATHGIDLQVDRTLAAGTLRALIVAVDPTIEAFAALDEADLGAAREAGLDPAARRRTGAHSTPRELADAVAADGLDALQGAGGGSDTPRVLDPAAGGAALLLAVGRALMTRAGSADRAARRGAVAAALFGVERDPGAAAIARAAIALWSAGDGGSLPDVSHQIAVGDVLGSIDRDAVLAALAVPHLGGVAAELARDTADALVDGFHAVPAIRRTDERQRREVIARAAARGDLEAQARLAAWAASGRARGAVHPSLLWSEPFDLAVLNPPFLGGKRIATVHGDAYAAWLADREPRATGNADLAAHVLLATRRWLAPRSAIALLATNTLIEGATRHAALERLLAEGHVIDSAWRSARWPGTASVNVVRIALARGGAGASAPRLDGAPVASIDAGLRAATRRAPPRPLAENAGLAFIGCFLRGDGFVLEDDEAQALLALDPAHGLCLRRYLVGEDVLRDPRQRPRRWVIDFGTRSLDEARAMPALLEVLERRVRPVREALPSTGSNRSHRRGWWRFANPRPELRRALTGRTSCLVAPRVGKHLAFVSVPAELVFSEQLVVVACDAPGRLGALTSWVHDAWARAHSSSLQTGLRYLPTRAFATFPFPTPDVAVDRVVTDLVAARTSAMATLRIGLTTLRDRVDAEAEDDACVVRVRTLHDALDRAVLASYGWGDLSPPARGRASARDRESFELAVIERLADENERRARRGDGAATLV